MARRVALCFGSLRLSGVGGLRGGHTWWLLRRGALCQALPGGRRRAMGAAGVRR